MLQITNDHVRTRPSLAIGVLGITGLTGYLGIKKGAFIENGENQTVVVSGAAGACGSIAGQVKRCNMFLALSRMAHSAAEV